jgi:hypothetical protein
MSKTNDHVDSTRHETSPDNRDRAGVARRMGIGHSIGAQWQVTGHKLIDGSVETRDADPFLHVGFYSRPRHDDNSAESVVLFIGGAEHPIIIATRHEPTRSAMANIDIDESVMFNSQTKILIRQNGTVEITTAGGAPKAVAFKSDVDDLWDKFNHHKHPETGTLTGAPQPTDLGGPASGTQLLKSE